jgi:hypothetical protein
MEAMVTQREERSTKRQQKQLRRHTAMPALANTDCICPTCNKVYGSQIGLQSPKNSPLTQKGKSSSNMMDYHKQVSVGV